MVLKNLEGNLSLFKHSLEGVFKKNIFTKLAYLVVRGGLNDFADQFDYTEIGGTPIFGVQKLMIKAHGSSNELALYNALKKAEEMAEKDFISQIGE
jgi:glycerol-3-phosphate acyltransferase PlsX